MTEGFPARFVMVNVPAAAIEAVEANRYEPVIRPATFSLTAFNKDMAGTNANTTPHITFLTLWSPCICGDPDMVSNCIALPGSCTDDLTYFIFPQPEIVEQWAA